MEDGSLREAITIAESIRNEPEAMQTSYTNQSFYPEVTPLISPETIPFLYFLIARE
jgi:hypothetical protein